MNDHKKFEKLKLTEMETPNFDIVTPEWIEQKLSENNLKKSELAKACNTSSSRVSNWLKGNMPPIAQALVWYYFDKLKVKGHDRKEIQEIISQHSDYNMYKPFWINLCWHEDLSDKDREKLSNYLNEYFKEHGPDACDDFTSYQSRLMKWETAELAVKYAFEKAGLDYISEVIDGSGSLETDGREDDPVTGELLHGYPIHDPSIIEDLEYLFEEDKLSKDDWRYLDMVCDGLFSLDWKRTDDKVKVLLEKVVMKFHQSKQE